MRCEKRLVLPNLYNCRDMGGVVGQDGRLFLHHKLYRSDVPDQLTKDEWQQLYQRGIRTVIDLRSLAECEQMNYQPPQGIRRICMPMQQSQIQTEQGDLERVANTALMQSLIQVYDKILFENLPQIADILRVILEQTDRGGILFHCSLGKDRTGVLAAVLYCLCGVADVDIVADYQVSQTYIQASPRIQTLFSQKAQGLLKSQPDTMQNLLQTIHKQGIAHCLGQVGFSINDQQALRQKLLE